MRKKSRYKPRRVNPDALSYVLNGFLPVSTAADAMMVLKTQNHGALANLAKGVGDQDDVAMITYFLITTASLAEIGMGRDWLPEITQAQAALSSLTERGARTGRFVFTGPELTAVNLAMDVHDAQIDGCTIAQFEKAIIRAKTAIQCNHAPRVMA